MLEEHLAQEGRLEVALKVEVAMQGHLEVALAGHREVAVEVGRHLVATLALRAPPLPWMPPLLLTLDSPLW